MGKPAPLGVAASGLPPAGDVANAVLSGVFSAVGPSQPFAFRGPLNVALWAAVNTALTTTLGSLAATVASATGLAAGYAINSANVPPGATIGALAGTNVTIALPPVTYYGTTNGRTAIIENLDVTAGLIGSTVTGPNIPAGTTVTGIITPAVAATNDSPGTRGAVQISAIPTAATTSAEIRSPFVFRRIGDAIAVGGADAAATFSGSGANYTGSVQLERSFDGGTTWLVCGVGGGGAMAIWNAGTPVNITFGEPEKNVLYRLNCTALSAGTINYRLSETGGAAESLSIQLI